VGTVGPYVWEPHLVAWVAIAIGIGLVIGGHLRLVRTRRPPIRWRRRQIALFCGACILSVVALTWPLADLAAHWSLIALVTQRLLLLMGVAPLLLLGLPYDLVQWLTRPAPIDALVVRLRRPLVAIAAVTVVAIGSMTPIIVRAQAGSAAVRGLVDVSIVLAGLVLWLPVIGRIPGSTRPQPVVRFAYLVAQAVVPAFLSFIYIFSKRPLYPQFARSHIATGLTPLTDQQIAGFVSKLTMLLVLLIVGAVVLARAPRTDDELEANEPLVWADVEREFERADRHGNKSTDQSPDLPDPPPPSGMGPAPASGPSS
jgi:putative membrane protein